MSDAVDGAEHLKPETTANPSLHRFFAFMAARAVDSDAQLPAQDLQVQHTLSCPFAHKDTAQAALDQLPHVFSVRQQVCILNTCRSIEQICHMSSMSGIRCAY